VALVVSEATPRALGGEGVLLLLAVFEPVPVPLREGVPDTVLDGVGVRVGVGEGVLLDDAPREGELVSVPVLEGVGEGVGEPVILVVGEAVGVSEPLLEGVGEGEVVGEGVGEGVGVGEGEAGHDSRRSV